MNCDIEPIFKEESAVIDYHCLPQAQWEEIMATLSDTTDPCLISEHLQDQESALTIFT